MDYTKKTNWDSLSTLKRKIEEDKTSKEKVVSFNGLTLETNLYHYGLYAGELTRHEAVKIRR